MSNRYQKSNEMLEEVKKVIPLATQTFSKSYLQYIKGQAPLFVTHADGAYIWDVDGNKYIDFINGLLSVYLGYNYKPVNDSIIEQLGKGINFSLPSVLESELAQKLIDIIPCAEMVRFGKNGSDVTSGAIRVARAVTRRDHVAVCGYHGWHDWYIGSTTRHLGVPESTRALTHKFTYNDIDSLEVILKKNEGNIAAVIMEAMNYEEPEDDFLKKVKELAHKHGALLIFDEVITGFRFGLGGAQALFGVTPDLATFGKSMANGMPISALVGKKEYMQKIDDIFYSFTYGGEALSIAASLATIKEIEEKDVVQEVEKKGIYLKEKTIELIEKHNLSSILSLKGRPFWSILFVEDTDHATGIEIKSYMQQEILARGFLWYGQHNMSFSHTQEHLDDLLQAYDELFPQLKQLLDTGKLKESLKGEPITNIFKVR
ncbi:aminotransferase class III-fold pyridoxal phosphate-dependent enzyme [Patescibacteria group bacterium]|nr:aminotransferase class III-fold pyridoxal phosphate-dependent enzyme [Patescibacteria group bacterium]MBU1722109.1 aminotransferase class III-fold pyridoxal phosphate-dependent enzyme [Patescibacteria group bacterium]MBU1901599.1 aminotransferase class III-fold pyridoxal phosphate-dependent enzyme [Patescibacteria group bacterium]